MEIPTVSQQLVGTLFQPIWSLPSNLFRNEIYSTYCLIVWDYSNIGIVCSNLARNMSRWSLTTSRSPTQGALPRVQKKFILKWGEHKGPHPWAGEACMCSPGDILYYISVELINCPAQYQFPHKAKCLYFHTGIEENECWNAEKGGRGFCCPRFWTSLKLVPAWWVKGIQWMFWDVAQQALVIRIY
jgi:hypothetical protein